MNTENICAPESWRCRALSEKVPLRITSSQFTCEKPGRKMHKIVFAPIELMSFHTFQDKHFCRSLETSRPLIESRSLHSILKCQMSQFFNLITSIQYKMNELFDWKRSHTAEPIGLSQQCLKFTRFSSDVRKNNFFLVFIPVPALVLALSASFLFSLFIRSFFWSNSVNGKTYEFEDLGWNCV